MQVEQPASQSVSLSGGGFEAKLSQNLTIHEYYWVSCNRLILWYRHSAKRPPTHPSSQHPCQLHIINSNSTQCATFHEAFHLLTKLRITCHTHLHNICYFSVQSTAPTQDAPASAHPIYNFTVNSCVINRFAFSLGLHPSQPPFSDYAPLLEGARVFESTWVGVECKLENGTIEFSKK